MTSIFTFASLFIVFLTYVVYRRFIATKVIREVESIESDFLDALQAHPLDAISEAIVRYMHEDFLTAKTLIPSLRFTVVLKHDVVSALVTTSGIRDRHLSETVRLAQDRLRILIETYTFQWRLSGRLHSTISHWTNFTQRRSPTVGILFATVLILVGIGVATFDISTTVRAESRINFIGDPLLMFASEFDAEIGPDFEAARTGQLKALQFVIKITRRRLVEYPDDYRNLGQVLPHLERILDSLSDEKLSAKLRLEEARQNIIQLYQVQMTDIANGHSGSLKLLKLTPTEVGIVNDALGAFRQSAVAFYDARGDQMQHFRLGTGVCLSSRLAALTLFAVLPEYIQSNRGNFERFVGELHTAHLRLKEVAKGLGVSERVLLQNFSHSIERRYEAFRRVNIRNMHEFRDYLNNESGFVVASR